MVEVEAPVQVSDCIEISAGDKIVYEIQSIICRRQSQGTQKGRYLAFVWNGKWTLHEKGHQTVVVGDIDKLVHSKEVYLVFTRNGRDQLRVR